MTLDFAITNFDKLYISSNVNLLMDMFSMAALMDSMINYEASIKVKSKSKITICFMPSGFVSTYFIIPFDIQLTIKCKNKALNITIDN